MGSDSIYFKSTFISFDKSSWLPEEVLAFNFSVLFKHFRSESNLLKYLSVVY